MTGFRIDPVRFSAKRVPDFLLQPRAVLGEPLVLHVLQHLLELRPAPVLGREPGLRDRERRLMVDVAAGLSGPM